MQSRAAAQPLDGPLMQGYQALAKRHNLWLSLGGFQVPPESCLTGMSWLQSSTDPLLQHERKAGPDCNACAPVAACSCWGCGSGSAQTPGAGLKSARLCVALLPMHGSAGIR